MASRHDPVKTWIQEHVPHFGRELMAGGAAGAVGKTCVAPLERTKILLMTGRSQAGAYQTLRLLLVSEGIPGLFRGNCASCLRIMPYAAIHFSVYEVYRRLLAEHVLPVAPYLGAGGGTRAATGKPAAPAPPAPAVEDDGSVDSPVEAQADLIAPVAPSPLVLTSSYEVATSTSETAAELLMDSEEDPLAGVQATLSAVAAESTAPSPVRAQQHQHQHQPPAAPRVRLGPLGDLLAGSAAGATAVLMTYPLDVVRTRLAWAMDAGAARPAAVRGLAAAGAPAAGGGGSAVAVAAAATASQLGGAGRLAAPGGSPTAHRPSRIMTMLAHIVRHEGVLGLYSGLAPTLYGIIPYAGLKFYVYGSLKQWYRTSLQPALQGGPHQSPGAAADGGGDRRRHGSERLPVPYMLAFGGVSGLLAQTVTYPLDVVRRRMQVSGLQREAVAPNNSRMTTWGLLAAIVRKEGVRGLTRGMSINYVKVVPSTAIGFTTYELFKSYLGVTGNL